jgi:hypothetical protein
MRASDGPKLPGAALPKIERIAALIKETADKIADLPQTSLRDALTTELRAISEAILDLAARASTKRQRIA